MAFDRISRRGFCVRPHLPGDSLGGVCAGTRSEKAADDHSLTDGEATATCCEIPCAAEMRPGFAPRRKLSWSPRVELYVRASREKLNVGRGERLAERVGALDWHAHRLYCLSHWLWVHNHRASALLVAALNRVLTGVDMGPSAEFGPGLVIRHGHGLHVAPTVRGGRDCALYHGVTLGTRPGGKPSRDGAPTLGDRVTVFPGAKVLGDITLGDDANIGPNTVVIRDVPAGATVTAPLGRIG